MQLITVEQDEFGRWAFVARNGDVQIGWCTQGDEGWFVEDTDCNRLTGPFRAFADAVASGEIVLAHLAGESNPGW